LRRAGTPAFFCFSEKMKFLHIFDLFGCFCYIW
jgi:hypothetical protein